jgi:hypothetical protein
MVVSHEALGNPRVAGSYLSPCGDTVRLSADDIASAREYDGKAVFECERFEAFGQTWWDVVRVRRCAP